MNIAIQISPEAKAAYFQSYVEVAEQELSYVFGAIPYEHVCIGTVEFFYVQVTEEQHPLLLKLSFAQGLFVIEGDSLRPLSVQYPFRLHADFVFGNKYRGKTNERLTQLLLNVGLASCTNEDRIHKRVLDPMCGRGTTLLWAMRYGLDGYGIDIDPKAMEDIRRNIKKWTKIHRQKHSLKQGFLGVKPNKKKEGVCIEFRAEDSLLKSVHGDSRSVRRLFKKESFDLIISDIPYGVQHVSSKGTRNPIQTIEESIPSWNEVLCTGGVIVLSFNRNHPKRKVLVEAFVQHGFRDVGFSIPHRMSESIVRDVVIFERAES
jgi:SAM-dependent methyltransferase